MKIKRSLLVLSLFALTSTSASVRASGILEPELIGRLENAANRGLAGELAEIADQLRARMNRGPATRQERYTLAYVLYRLASVPMGVEPSLEERKELLEDAQAILEGLVEAEPENVESLSLLAGVLGLRIGTAPTLAMRLGPRAGAVLGKAARLEPDHPRVALQLGVSALNAPRMFGGGVTKAESHLRRAVALFASQPSAAPWPHWGGLDALARLGQALARQGKVDQARAAYQQALAIERDLAWVRYVLLPELEAGADQQ